MTTATKTTPMNGAHVTEEYLFMRSILGPECAVYRLVNAYRSNKPAVVRALSRHGIDLNKEGLSAN